MTRPVSLLLLDGEARARAAAASEPKTTVRPEPVRSTHVTKREAAAAREAIERLETVGRLVTRSLLILGTGALVFTCVNVTVFAIAHHVSGWVAWMLDPLASLALLTVLYVDGILAEQGSYRASGWPFALRWFAGLSTWVMNCWQSLYPDGTFHIVPQYPDAGGLLLHSVAPLLLIILAEASAGYRTYLAEQTAAYRRTISAYEDLVRAEQEARARRAQEERERAEEAARELARLEREAEIENAREAARLQREREAHEAEHEAREHAARLEREARAAEIEKARELARLERDRQERAAEIEAKRLRVAAEIEAAERDREAQREAQRIQAEAEARALEEDARAKRLGDAERRKARRQDPDSRNRGSSKSASRSAGVPDSSSTSGASKSGERIPREVRETQREEAERRAAVALLNNETPDPAALAKPYCRGETWGGDRVRAARRRLAEEAGFEDEVIAAALHELDADEPTP
ncbi:hypothetical protein [Streptomyces netropsis]|uniref:IgA-specific serine endopeptidase autotransporter n=1 Tax=Streptomyces netropsis TaxID=55404 RepID=A0A7W7LHM0_STRNE|nr:hypothetical protein [Streptomyces netropsis]MBB4890092.1 hypothetical protein [Streptomyces netropsis]GGR43238.1 hypothetical protein GCM10010219_55980 [Streptomyces netropsis]